MNYCSVTDVINIVRIYEGDWDDISQTIPTALIEQYITEESDFIRTKLQERYEISIIEAYSPLPYSIIKTTALGSALKTLSRVGPVSIDRSNAMKESLKLEYTHWIYFIERGSLIDNSGVYIPIKSVRLPLTQNKDFNTKVSAVYSGKYPRTY